MIIKYYFNLNLFIYLVYSLKEIEICELEKKHEEQSNSLRLQFNNELNRHKNEFENEKLKLILSHDHQIVELQKTNKLEVSQMQKLATEKQFELTQNILVLENESVLLKTERDVLKEENQRLVDEKKLHVLFFNNFFLTVTKLKYVYFSRIQTWVIKNFAMKQNH